LEKFGSQTPFGRPGQPVELASIYVQRAAADASYATGQVYGSSGGAGNHSRQQRTTIAGRKWFLPYRDRTDYFFWDF